MSRFIDDVAVKVIETCLVGQLREIMESMSGLKLDDGATERLAGETKGTDTLVRSSRLS